MSRRWEAFLDRLTFRPVVPAVAGLALLILSLLAQLNPAVNGLSPVLQVHTWSSLKGRSLPLVWRSWHTFLFCGVGTALLLMACVRRVRDGGFVRS